MSSPLPICPLVRLFSLFYDCAPSAVSPCHHGNLVSLLLATHCVRAECSAVPPRYLYSQSAPQECVWVFVCSMSMSEELLICGPLRSILSVFLSHTRTQTHTHSHTCCQIRAAAHRVVWSLAWELGWIRQAAAVWYSCHPLSTAGVARHSLKFNQSPPGPKASVYSHTQPLTPTCHTCHSQAIETQTPKPALPIWTPALLFSSRSTTLLSSFHHPTTLLVHSLNNTPSLLGSYVKTIVWTWMSPNCSALCHTETLTWVKANIWHWENHIFAAFLSLVK